MVGIVARRPVEGHSAARLAMTWKDRQRTRVPVVDLDDNPFCVERRTNEEWHMMQLNKNPSLVQLTSADVPRTASFMVDSEKPFRDFSRKKRNLLAWSLRAVSATGMAAQEGENQKRKPTKRVSRTVPSDIGGINVVEFFNQELGSSDHLLCPTNRVDIDIDTLPNLEPYRREVVAQQPVTFGHRPVSASRMFNPCTMATSCVIPSGGNSKTSGARLRNQVGANSKRRGGASLKRGRNNKLRRTTGLRAPVLKALLRGGPQPGGGGAAAAMTIAPRQQKPFEPIGITSVSRDSTPKAKYLALGGQGDASDSSINSERLDDNMWRPVAPGQEGVLGDLEATWLTNSSQQGLGQGRRELGNSVEGLKLQRIFSADRPPWDGTPAPLPAPQNVRRAISLLLMPDPEERLRDKLIKSRKAAAGVPVTASTAMDEREKELRPFHSTPSVRWEVCPATPRAVIAREEIRRLVESRMERDSIMAKKVRQAELSVFFNKITPSDKLYRNTLQTAQDRFHRQETTST